MDNLTEEENEARIEAIEHSDVLLAIRAVLKTESGKKLFKYLFKQFLVIDQPPVGLKDYALYEYWGFLRAGKSIFKLTAQADAEIAASLLAQNEKDSYAKLYKDAKIGQS